MTYSVYNLTDHAQLSIRGTTGTHPDSKFVFGIFLDKDRVETDGSHAYEDMDWSEAVKMAKWILNEDKWIKRAIEEEKE